MQATEIDVRGEFARLHDVLDSFEALREEGDGALSARSPEVSGWSVEQHLYHIALATDLAFQHVRSLVRQKGGLIQSEGELDPVAAAVLGRDLAERGAAKAPRIVTPDEEVNREFLAMEQRGNRETLGKLEEIADEIQGAPGWIPHQVLGPLRAAHWLRFAALHARHHLAIVEDVRAASDG
ncbi:MAG: DinB family protein [Planctomycetota bacterium]